MPIDEIISHFQSVVGLGTYNNKVEQAVEAAIPILRRAKEVDVNLLKKVIEGRVLNYTHPEEYKRGIDDAFEQVLDWITERPMLECEAKRQGIDIPGAPNGALIAEAKRLGLEVENG